MSSTGEEAVMEMLQRSDPNPIEIALAFKRMMERRGFNQDQLAQQIGKKRSTVANYLRLLSLEEPIQDSLVRQKVTMGHAKALLSLSSKEARLLLHRRIEREGLSVRSTEQLAKIAKVKSETPELSKEEEIHLKAVADALQRRLSTKVQLTGSYERGTLSIDYYSLSDLERLLDLLER